MSETTLEDLRTMTGYLSEWVEEQTRPATVQDLIEAVESIGGEIRYMTKLGDGQVSENGRYLILRIEKDSNE